MTDDERERIFDEARSTLERTKDIAPDVAPPLLEEDRLFRWKRKADEFTAERERSRAEIASASRPSIDWNEVDRRIAAAIEYERSVITEAFGEELGRLLAEGRRDVCEKFRELEISAARLETKVGELRAQLATDRSRSTVVDLPRLPLRNVN